MKFLNSSKNQSGLKTGPTSRISFITDERSKLAIPVGPRFQVELPSWNPRTPKSRLTLGKMESDDEKWLGIRVWPLRERSQDTNNDMVGKGRPHACICDVPGSIECVRQHVFDKRSQLKIDLGPAFWKWKFDVMGENVSKLWNYEEHRKFDCIVKKNLTSRGTSFMKSASQCFPSLSKASIVSYYLNMYIPRRIAFQTRLGFIIVDSDDDEDDNDDEDVDNIVIDVDDDDGDGEGEDVLHTTRASRKRARVDYTNSNHKYMKTALVTSCR